ncbi:5'-methylthioadenosine/S-adenosylhomocysteine nucleosidase family protein [Sorangium sp. KYC3313]|uniref:5'-methylthioadenosine/S-adenosylhomocysteine nucleosidase family protein n=1 Tax=Sorangium sp. KYC3313 TaxID=3449740 RepID=UPI003F89836F
MSMLITDDVFIAFLEAAQFEDGQLPLGAAINPSQVARTAGLDVTVVHACVERLIADGLGHASQDDPNGFQIDDARVRFTLHRLQRRATKSEQGSVYNIQIENSTIAAFSAGERAGASGTANVPTGSFLQNQRASNLSPAPRGTPAHGTQDLRAAGEPDIDFAILTAIEVERRAVCAAFGLTEKDRVKKGGRWYWRGKLPLRGGDSYEIVVAQPVDMGQVEAAILASDVIRHWSPNAALLVGIAASTDPNKVKHGDIVVGKSVWYYEHGKVTPEGTKPQPEMIPADAALLKHFVGMANWGGTVPVKRPDRKRSGTKVHLGVIASGEKVIANAAVRDEIASGHRKILAVEMEGYGFSRAVWESFERVHHLDIRGICDDASSSKGDRWHKYAAAAAAEFAKHFLLDRPITPTRKPYGNSPFRPAQ